MKKSIFSCFTYHNIPREYTVQVLTTIYDITAWSVSVSPNLEENSEKERNKMTRLNLTYGQPHRHQN